MSQEEQLIRLAFVVFPVLLAIWAGRRSSLAGMSAALFVATWGSCCIALPLTVLFGWLAWGSLEQERQEREPLKER
jgi:membrane protein implicated in regulation of membrane protease activity